jgi:four helix bundle protein
MDGIRSVEDLEVFRKGHTLTLKVYSISKTFPSEERFGLTPQIRRSASSIGANLMEGGYRLNRKEFRQFAGIARGSTGELKYHLLLAKDLKYLPEAEYVTFRAEADEISKMLNGLIRSLSDEHRQKQ